MSEHPAPEVLERFLRGELTPRQGAPVIRHLVRGCPRCESALAPHENFLFRREEEEKPAAAAGDRTHLASGFDELVLPEDACEAGEELQALATAEATSGDVYDAALDRAFAAVRRATARRERGSRTVDEAQVALATGGLASLTGWCSSRFRGPALCIALLRRSQGLRYENPIEMVRMAKIAVLTARNLDPRRYGPKRVADLQARAWGELGNAHRITGELTSADRALTRALEIFHEGTRDSLLGARLLSLRASLLGSRRCFAEALAILDQVEETYEHHGELQQIGKTVIKQGLYTGYAGEAEAAVGLLRRGLDLVDEVADPQLALVAVHNLAWFSMEAGRPREARAIVWRYRRLYENDGERVVLLKRIWLQGRIDACLGQLERAARRLAEAQRGLDAANLGYQAALAALDLCEVWLRQGKSKMAAGLVEQAVETFFALNIDREAIGALRLLQQAFEREVATLAVVQHAIAFFRRLQNDPAARFEPEE